MHACIPERSENEARLSTELAYIAISIVAEPKAGYNDGSRVVVVSGKLKRNRKRGGTLKNHGGVQDNKRLAVTIYITH